MMKNDRVTAIIVSYHTGAILWRNIEQILLQNNLFELIIVNNGNPEHVCKELDDLAKNNKQIRILTPGNIGFAKACNLGVKHSQSQYIAIINPDSIICGIDSFKYMISFLKDHDDAYLIGAKILNIDNSIQKTSVRNMLNLSIFLSEGLLLNKIPIIGKLFPKINIDVNSICDPIIVKAISGAFLFLKKIDYDNIKGFDEGYFLHVEDIDFCRRVNEIGKKIYYLPNVNIIHYLSTSKVSSIFVEYHKLKSFSRYFAKYYNNLISYIVTTLLSFRLFIKYALNILSKITPNNIINNLTNYDQDIIENKLFDNIDNIEKIRKITIASVSNQIGICVLAKLVNSNFKIDVLYRNSSINHHLKDVNWIRTDFTKSDNIILDSDILIYTGGIWMLPNLLNNISSKISRLICFSSTSIFTKNNTDNKYEKNVIDNIKSAEEKIISICNQNNINYTIIRPTMIYGIKMDRNINLIVNFIDKFKFFPLLSEMNGLRQPVHVDDLASSVIDIIDNVKTYNKCYNLSGGEIINYKNMIYRIFDQLNVKRRFINIKYLLLFFSLIERFTGKSITKSMIKRMNDDMIFSNKEAIDDFDYHPRKFSIK